MMTRRWYFKSAAALVSTVLTWGLMTPTLAAGLATAEPLIGSQQVSSVAWRAATDNCQTSCRQCHRELIGLRRHCRRPSRKTAASRNSVEVRRLKAALSDAHSALTLCQSSQPGSINSKQLDLSDDNTGSQLTSKKSSENRTTDNKTQVQDMDKKMTQLPPGDENVRDIGDSFLPSVSGGDGWFAPVSSSQRVDEEVSKFTPALVDGTSTAAEVDLDAENSEVPSGSATPSDAALPTSCVHCGGSSVSAGDERARALGGSESAATTASSASGSSEDDSPGGHQYDALVFMFNAIIIGIVITHVTMMPILESLQQTVSLFVMGVLYSILQEWLKSQLGVFGASYNMWMNIDPHTLMFTMLPVLLTGDAMTIDTSIARRVASQCIYLAGPGVLLQAFLIAGFLQVYLPHDWSFLLCLTLGAIFAATDPVAVVSLLKELGASPVLTVQIQGESLLNDGTAIVLYTIAYDMLKGEQYDVGEIIVILIKSALCAAGLGCTIGWVFVFWIRSASNRLDHHSTMVQIALTLCCAYWSFIISEGVLHISGVLCTVSSALVMADKMWPSIVSKEAMSHVWHVLEYLGNTLIFFLAGALTGKTMTRMPLMDYLHLIVIYIILFVIRTTVLFVSRPILKYLSPKREAISKSEAVVMSWGGLRGAVGLALAIQVSIEGAGGKLEELDANRVLFYTGGVAALTLTVNATTCPTLVRWLGITQTPWAKRRMMHCIHRQLEILANGGKHPAPVHKVLNNLLNEVRAVMDAVVERAGKLEENRQSIRKSLSSMTGGSSAGLASSRLSSQASSRLSSLVSLTSDVPKKRIPHGRILVDRYQEMKELLCFLPAQVIECGIIEFPEIPYETNTREIESLVRDHDPDPLLVRTVNEGFLSLVRAQYWKSIDAGEFERTTHAELLLGSITSAFSRAHHSLVDLRFVLRELDGMLVKKLGRSGWKAKLRMYQDQSKKSKKKKEEQQVEDGRRETTATTPGDDNSELPRKLASEIRDSIANGTSLPRSATADLDKLSGSLSLGTSKSFRRSGEKGEKSLGATSLAGDGASDENHESPYNIRPTPTLKSTNTGGWGNSDATDGFFFERASRRQTANSESAGPPIVNCQTENWHEYTSWTKRALGNLKNAAKPQRLFKTKSQDTVIQSMNCVQLFIDSKAFTFVMAFAIAANSIFIWAEENFRNDENNANKVWFAVDTTFLVIFTFEFLCKLLAMKHYYFLDMWNVFDFVLVVLGVMSFIFEVMLTVASSEATGEEAAGAADAAGEARLIRLTRVFRVLRILRVFRLAGFYPILKAKLMHQDFSQKVAESLQSVTCLSAFVKAHVKSQEELVRFTGGIEDGQLVVEVARCLIESRTAVYQALALAVVEAAGMDGEVVLAMNLMRECNFAAAKLTDFVLDAHKSGMLNAKEAETFLHPLRHCQHEVFQQRQQSIMGFRKQPSQNQLKKQMSHIQSIVSSRSPAESAYGIEKIIDEAKEAIGHSCCLGDQSPHSQTFAAHCNSMKAEREARDSARQSVRESQLRASKLSIDYRPRDSHARDSHVAPGCQVRGSMLSSSSNMSGVDGVDAVGLACLPLNLPSNKDRCTLQSLQLDDAADDDQAVLDRFMQPALNCLEENDVASSPSSAASNKHCAKETPSGHDAQPPSHQSETHQFFSPVPNCGRGKDVELS